MAELKVEVVKIDSVEPHPNADRMELAFIGGYQCCVQIGSFKAGDLGVYIPVDSVLPEKLEAYIFGSDAKVKLNKHRVRAIKLRGAVAFGLLLTTDRVLDYFNANRIVAGCVEGYDLTDVLGITKYVPPVKHLPQKMQGKLARHHHPSFTKYTSINHLKKYWDAFECGEPIHITEKIHGTNFRTGWVPFAPRTFWQKVKGVFGRNPKWEFVYGSHNVQLMDGNGKTAFADNVYHRIVEEHSLQAKIPKGQLWYGEIYGAGIQKGYSYGLSGDNVNVMFMDVKVVKTNTYMDFDAAVDTIKSFGECPVPHMVAQYNQEQILSLLNDPGRKSLVDLKTYPVEGFVIRPMNEQSFYGGRLILKILSDEYLLSKSGSDWK